MLLIIGKYVLFAAVKLPESTLLSTSFRASDNTKGTLAIGSQRQSKILKVIFIVIAQINLD